MTAFLIPLLFAAAAPQPPPILTVTTVPAVDFDVDELHYQIPLPQGFCQPPRATFAARLKDSSDGQGHILAKPVYLIKCNRNGFENDVEVVYFKYFRNFSVTPTDRAAFIEAYAPAINGEDYKNYIEADETREKARAAAADEGAGDVKTTAESVPLGSDDTCIYHGVRMTLTEPGHKPINMMTASCTTMLDGAMLMIDTSAKVERGLSFADLTKRLNTIVNSISAKKRP